MTLLDALRGDLRFAVRSLKRAPGFTAVAVTTLSVGIGAVTALFSLVYSYAFRPLPYNDAERIVAISEWHPRYGTRYRSVSVDASRTLLTGTRSFERKAVFASGYASTMLAGTASSLQTLSVDSSFMQLFAIQPQRGRLFTADEIRDNAPVGVISDQLWRTGFAADPSVVGRPVRFGDRLVTIVGVLPPGFRYPYQTDLWRPLAMSDTSVDDVTFLAKRRWGISDEAVAAELSVIARRLAQTDSQQFAGVRFTTEEMLDRHLGGALPIVGLFIGAALFVLLIACSNVANLLLVRAAERRGEMAVRSSLGAGRGRLLTQALTEAVVLAGSSGFLGTVLSVALLKVALAIIPTAGFPSWLTFGLDGRVLLFTVGIVALVTLAVGVMPAREGLRFDLVRALKAGGDGGAVGGGVLKSARRGIVIQLALSVVLFVGASLLVQTYRRLAVIDVGYPAEEIVNLQLYFDAARYPSDSVKMRVAQTILDRARTLAGARYATIRGDANITALAERLPAARNRGSTTRADLRIFTDGDTTHERASARSVSPAPRFFAIGDAYFQAFGLRIVRGRSFGADDVPGAATGVVLSRRLADVLWPATNPIGRALQFGARGSRITVVGIAEDVRDLKGGLSGLQSVPRADLYFSVRQVAAFNPAVLIRGSRDVTPLQAGAQKVVRAMAPDLQFSTYTLARDTEIERMTTRVFGTLIGSFAICGLILSVIGIYGVVAYGINQRTREIGIRIALGGTRHDVLRLVMRQSVRLVGIGLGVGIVLSFGTGRLLRVLLFGVSATDPFTYAVVCVLFGAVAALACYLPARRVTLVDPLVALRAD